MSGTLTRRKGWNMSVIRLLACATCLVGVGPVSAADTSPAAKITELDV